MNSSQGEGNKSMCAISWVCPYRAGVRPPFPCEIGSSWITWLSIKIWGAWTPATFAGQNHHISKTIFQWIFIHLFKIRFLVKWITVSGTVVDMVVRGWCLYAWRRQNTIKWIDTWTVKMIPDPNTVMGQHSTAELWTVGWNLLANCYRWDEYRNREMVRRHVSCLLNLYFTLNEGKTTDPSLQWTCEVLGDPAPGCGPQCQVKMPPVLHAVTYSDLFNAAVHPPR